jgi:polyhydroxybutyrate depolymerase
VAVVLVGAAAGCGSDDEDPARRTSDSVTTTTSAPSPACRGGGRTAAVERLDVTVDGTPRTAQVHVPSNAVGSDPVSVVLSFHGLSGSASLQRATDGLTDKADEEGFVAVHPEGLLVGLNDQVTGTSGWDADGSDVDEPAFVAALIDELGAQVCIDLSRVYATGFSAGAYNALTVACALPDRIAAVATVSAAYQSTACSSGRAMPTLAFHGLDDIVTPFEGRRTAEAGTFVPVLDALDAQASRNGCTDGADTGTVTATVESLTWAGCAAPTVLYRLRDHGHAWPGHPLPFTADVLAPVLAGSAGQPPDPLMIAIGETPGAMAENVLLTNVDIDATDLIWDFFAASR